MLKPPYSAVLGALPSASRNKIQGANDNTLRGDNRPKYSTFCILRILRYVFCVIVQKEGVTTMNTAPSVEGRH